MSWIQPNSHTGWTNGANGYDADTNTYAYTNVSGGNLSNSIWMYYDTPVMSDTVRIYLSDDRDRIDEVLVYVEIDNSWILVAQTTPTKGAYAEYSFTENFVTGIRVRAQNGHPSQSEEARLHDAAIFQTADEPTVITEEPTNISGYSADLQGNLASIGGEPSVDVFFDYRTTGREAPWSVNAADFCQIEVESPFVNKIEYISVKNPQGDIIMEQSNPYWTGTGYRDFTDNIIETQPGEELEIYVQVMTTVDGGADQAISFGSSIGHADLMLIDHITTHTAERWGYTYYWTVPNVPGNHLISWWCSHLQYYNACEDIEYGERQDYTIYIAETGEPTPGEWITTESQTMTETGTFEALAAPLSPVTEYEYKAIVAWDTQTNEGSIVVFSTKETFPELISGSSRTETRADLTLTIQLVVFFQYRLEGIDWIRTEFQTVEGSTEFQQLLEGLEPGNYEFRAIANHEARTVYGHILPFEITEIIPSEVYLSVTIESFGMPTVTEREDGSEVNLSISSESQASKTVISKSEITLHIKIESLGQVIIPMKEGGSEVTLQVSTESGVLIPSEVVLQIDAEGKGLKTQISGGSEVTLVVYTESEGTEAVGMLLFRGRFWETHSMDREAKDLLNFSRFWKRQFIDIPKEEKEEIHYEQY